MNHEAYDTANDGSHPSHHLQEFNDLVANVLMCAEELRRSLKESPSTDDVLDWRDRLEHLVSLAGPLARWTRDAVGSQLETDMFRHCEEKIQQVSYQLLQTSLQMKEPDPEDPYLTAPIQAVRTEGQAAVARIVELNVVLTLSATHNGASSSKESPRVKELLESYVNYERQVLRQRSKPGIARLVQARRDGLFRERHGSGAARTTAVDAEHDDAEASGSISPYHAPVIAEILGQAAALIHPLIQWLIHLPPMGEPGELQKPGHSNFESSQGIIARLCIDSIQTINTQAQELVQTISNWFGEDRPMEDWLNRTAADKTEACLDQYQLAALDSLVEEMSFACQVQARYLALFEDTTSLLTLEVTTLQDQLLPEFTWKYASLERYLALEQWHSAVALAVPVPIVIDTQIHVPSVVEDAQYLSTRALERAALTESTQAIGTVAHAISHDVWSTEVGGVCAALLEQRGCWLDPMSGADQASPQKHTRPPTSPPSSGFESGFVSALMEALDEEEPQPPPRSVGKETKEGGRTPRAPGSGNFLMSIVGSADQKQQQQVDSDFCVLNGFHAARVACRSLVTFLDTLLPVEVEENLGSQTKSMAMIRLAREELSQYGSSYELILKERVQLLVSNWCGCAQDEGVNWEGKLIPQLRVFFEVEDFNLHDHAFEMAEKDDRLNAELLGPFEESKFLTQLADKCDAAVLHMLGEAIVASITKLILDVLWINEKPFSDWGALLLSKEVRMLQRFCDRLVRPASTDAPPPNLLSQWERLSQVVYILQLEKPADWLSYSSTLTPEEVLGTMRLRADFSQDAVQAVVAQLSKSAASIHLAPDG